jgi:serine/threonine protein phosphatase 1
MILTANKLTLPTNTKGNDYVVGDIHGHVPQLLQQLDQMEFDPQYDRLICVGDLIDRGPESEKAIELLQEDWFFSTMGNHEYLMLCGLKHKCSRERMMWLQNGGEWVMHTIPDQWPPWFELLESMPIAIETVNNEGVKYGIVHADFPADDWEAFESFGEEELYRCIWSRRNFNNRSEHSVNGVDYLFHGHSVSDGELVLGNRHYIENGAFLGNPFIIRQL